jgi:hypothetical protein
MVYDDGSEACSAWCEDCAAPFADPLDELDAYHGFAVALGLTWATTSR